MSTTQALPHNHTALLWRPQGTALQLFVVLERSPAGLWTGFWDFPRAHAPHGAIAASAWPSGAARVVQHPTPGFAPHRSGTTVWAAQHTGPCEASCLLPEPGRVGRWLSPEALDEGHRTGAWALSPIVWPAVKALLAAQAQGADACAAVAQLSSMAAMGQPPDADVYGLADGIALVPLRTPTLPPATHTNCYLLGERALTIVDPGTPYPCEQEALIKLLQQRVFEGARIEAIWLSHFHDDHTGAANRLHALFGAPICAHADTAEALRGRTVVHRLLGDQQQLRADDHLYTALDTPGHARGHLCFWAHTGGHLLSGDNVLGTGTPIVPPSPHGNMGAYLRSLQHMAQRPLGLLLPGHGPPCPSAASRLAETLRARQGREALLLATLAALPEGATLTALCHKLYRGLAASLMGLAELSTLSHLEKLCADHKVVAQNAGKEARYRLSTPQKHP